MILSPLLESLLVALLLVALVARQFVWRAAVPRQLFTLPVIFVVAGAVAIAYDVAHGEALTGAALAVVGVEVALVFLTGLAMGAAAEFSRRGERLYYRLSRPGVLLWMLFVGVRIGSFIAAARFGVRVLETTGVIVLVFGLNRFISALVIARRIDRGYAGESGGLSPAPASG